MKKKIAITIILYSSLFMFWGNHEMMIFLAVTFWIFLALKSLRFLLFIERSRFQHIIDNYISEINTANCDEKLKDICLISLNITKNIILPHISKSLYRGGSTQMFIESLLDKIAETRLIRNDQIKEKHQDTDLEFALDFEYHYNQALAPLLSRIKMELIKPKIDFDEMENHFSNFLSTLFFGFIKLSTKDQAINSQIINLLDNLERINHVTPESVAFRKSYARYEREVGVGATTTLF